MTLFFPAISICFALSTLARWCISLSSYSGAGKPPMFGDYEAQRHWMEITYNLPVQEWYKNSTENDLMYWGLDYPPLTAYHSWICGFIANKINPDWVKLKDSQGYESYQHKLFMRYSVLLADFLIFFPAVYLFMTHRSTEKPTEQLKNSIAFLFYPGLMLIDHGHFQYNNISLGLALLAVTFLSRGRYLWGSVMFCLSLNYKQMELYHAMPFFCYLLGLCLRSTNGFVRLTKIGLVVIGTFAMCWLPFLTSPESVLQVVHRLFPFARGMFEDKVSNVWCSLSVIIKLKSFLTRDQQVALCLGSTIIGLLPSSVDLLIHPAINKFKFALINASLVFFLFSFQVHEKSILIPALIVAAVLPSKPFWCHWFLLLSTFSMLPLLIKDGLLLQFIASMVLYMTVYLYSFTDQKLEKPVQRFSTVLYALFCLSVVGMFVLTVASVTVPPPSRFPDLYPVLISMYSCAHFCVFLIYFHVVQFWEPSDAVVSDRKKNK